MDFLNKYFAQIKEVFEGMTPGARITSALLLVVTVASLGYLFTSGFHPGGDVFLLDNRAFTSDELTPMLAAFADGGTGGAGDCRRRIRVPRGKETAYVAALAKAGVLPHDFSSILDNALKRVDPFEDKAKFQARLRHRETAIFWGHRSGPWTEFDRATVIIDGEMSSRDCARASGDGLRHGSRRSGPFPLTDQPGQSIRQTMIGADAGLKPENVVVIDRTPASRTAARPATPRAETGRSWPRNSGARRNTTEARSTASARARTRCDRHSDGRTVARKKSHELGPPLYDKDNSVSVNMTRRKQVRIPQARAKGGRPGYAAQQQNNTARTLTTTESKGAEEKEKTSELVETKLPAGEETRRSSPPTRSSGSPWRLPFRPAGSPRSGRNAIRHRRERNPRSRRRRTSIRFARRRLARIKSLGCRGIAPSGGRRRHDAVRQDAVGGGDRLRGHHSAADSRTDLDGECRIVVRPELEHRGTDPAGTRQPAHAAVDDPFGTVGRNQPDGRASSPPRARDREVEDAEGEGEPRKIAFAGTGRRSGTN